MHILRVYLTAGPMIEHVYRGIGEARRDLNLLRTAAPDAFMSLEDDFGKATGLQRDQVAAWQLSDYDAELDGAVAINNAKQVVTEKVQRAAAARHGMIGAGGPQIVANGKMVTG